MRIARSVLTLLLLVLPAAAQDADPPRPTGDPAPPTDAPRPLADLLKEGRDKLLEVPILQNRKRLDTLDEFIGSEERGAAALRTELNGQDLAISRARSELKKAGEDTDAWAENLAILEKLYRSRRETDGKFETSRGTLERLRGQRAVVARKIRDYERIRNLVTEGEDLRELPVDPSEIVDVPVLPSGPREAGRATGIDTEAALATREAAVRTGNPVWRQHWIESLRKGSPDAYAVWLHENDRESFWALRRLREDEFRKALRAIDPEEHDRLYAAPVREAAPKEGAVDEKSFLRPK